MWIAYNPNPTRNRVGDCTIRALTIALKQDWDTVFLDLALHGFCLGNMPSANHVWGACLRRRGFVRRIIPDECPDCYTVADFCRDHPRGTYVLALAEHVIAVENGDYFDSWDSGDEIPIYYWTKE